MKQVKLLNSVNGMLEAVVEVRNKKEPIQKENKQSVVNDLILKAYKKECK